MNQIVKDKMMREIMIISNNILFGESQKESRFYSNDEKNFEEIILKNYEYMIRGEAEKNFKNKQIIPYGVVLNDKNEIFVYKRGGANSNAGDTRLHEKISIGVGGHIEREDEHTKNPLKDSLIREIEEEINVGNENIISIDAIGYINNESDEVSQVHFGIAYIIKIKSSSFDLLDGELEKGEFMSASELEKVYNSNDYDIEAWSKILIPEILKYLK